MKFQIKTLRGQPRTLGIQSLLQLLGDAINDEIIINGNIYRISSAQAIANPSTTVDWVITPLNIDATAQEEFVLPVTIDDPESAFLNVNNVDYIHGVHYHIEGNNLLWHGSFALEPNDEMYIKYPLPA